MGKWMSEITALTRVVEDPDAPVMARCKSLKSIPHPELAVLRRLLVETKTPRAKPVPSKLKALAALAYAKEMQLKKIRSQQRKLNKPTGSGNALGID
jgi:hypothetical protein